MPQLFKGAENTESPLDSKEIKPSILKEINPEHSLEKTLMLGEIEGKRRGQQRMRWLVDITDSTDMSLSKLGDNEGQGNLACCSPWGCKVRHNSATEQCPFPPSHILVAQQKLPFVELKLMF